VNLLMVSIAFGHSLAALLSLSSNSAAGQAAIYAPPSFHWTWLQTAGLSIGFDGLVTEPGLIAMTVITGLHVLVQIFSIGYLEMDWGWPRFFGALSFFEAGLCGLVLTDSVFFSYVLLELLTVGTYVIVGTWYNQSLVVKGARDAFLTKRIGDLILLAGVIALLPITGTWNFHGLQGWAADLTNNAQPLPPGFQLILLALVAGPMGKCAQIPLHLWLDEAMESPLPSTVLRNSVVVIGGAWVLLRLEPLIALSPLVQGVLVVVGGTTALVASLIALGQIDVKRALSFLVSSWLGLLFVAVGLGGIGVADHLLLVYPLPMALMLMSIGTIVISNVTQDLTQLGGLWSRRPLMGIAFLAGAAGLMGLPPFGGFAALRELLELAAHSQLPLVLGGLVLITNALLSAALMRVFGLIWGGRPPGRLQALTRAGLGADGLAAAALHPAGRRQLRLVLSAPPPLGRTALRPGRPAALAGGRHAHRGLLSPHRGGAGGGLGTVQRLERSPAGGWLLERYRRCGNGGSPSPQLHHQRSLPDLCPFACARCAADGRLAAVPLT
jgi:NAD(P)H-quinone oxidoreductase subunit 5